MTLKVNLTEEAEQAFSELLNVSGADAEDVILDALALIHCAIMETKNGKNIAIFNPMTREASIISLPTLKFVQNKRLKIH